MSVNLRKTRSRAQSAAPSGRADPAGRASQAQAQARGASSQARHS